MERLKEMFIKDLPHIIKIFQFFRGTASNWKTINFEKYFLQCKGE